MAVCVCGKMRWMSRCPAGRECQEGRRDGRFCGLSRRRRTSPRFHALIHHIGGAEDSHQDAVRCTSPHRQRPLVVHDFQHNRNSVVPRPKRRCGATNGASRRRTAGPSTTQRSKRHVRNGRWFHDTLWETLRWNMVPWLLDAKYLDFRGHIWRVRWRSWRLALRWSWGGGVLGHGAQEGIRALAVKGFARGTGLVGSIGFDRPVSGRVEVGGGAAGVLFLLGLCALGGPVVVARWQWRSLSPRAKGLFVQNGGYEYNLVLIVAARSRWPPMGPGRDSLDTWSALPNRNRLRRFSRRGRGGYGTLVPSSSTR